MLLPDSVGLPLYSLVRNSGPEDLDLDLDRALTLNRLPGSEIKSKSMIKIKKPLTANLMPVARDGAMRPLPKMRIAVHFPSSPLR